MPRGSPLKEMVNYQGAKRGGEGLAKTRLVSLHPDRAKMGVSGLLDDASQANAGLRHSKQMDVDETFLPLAQNSYQAVEGWQHSGLGRCACNDAFHGEPGPTLRPLATHCDHP